MKSSVIIIVAAICFGSLGYFLRGSSNTSQSEQNVAHEEDPSFTRSNRPPAKDSAAVIARVKSSLGKTDSRSLLKSSMDIFKLNTKEIEELLKGQEFTGVSYFGGGNTQLFSACFSRLAEINPENALSMAEKLNMEQQYLATTAVFQEWSSSDAEGALAAAMDLKNPQLKQAALSSALTNLAKEDPEKAFALAEEHNAYGALYSIVNQWAASDPAMALEKCEKLPAQQKGWMKSNIVSQWAQKDFEGASAYIEGIENKVEKLTAMSGLISGFAATDSDKAFELLAQNEDLINSDKLDNVLHQLAQSSPEKTISWIESSAPEDKKRNLISSMISSWFYSDEKAALTYYENIENVETKKSVGNSLLNNISHNDPKKFLNLYETMGGSDDENDWSYKSAIQKLAVDDLEYAKSYLEGVSDPKLKKIAFESMLKGLSKEEPEQALALANSVKDEVGRDAALAEVYKSLANKNPELVADAFIERGMKTMGEYGVDDFIYNYVRKDLEGAKSFVEKIEDPTLWNDSVQRLLSEWSNKNPVEAALYAFEQDPTKGIESAMWSIGRDLAKKDPKAGVELALSQPKNAISDRMLRSVLDGWIDNDLEGAVAMVSSLPVERVDLSTYGDVASQYASSNPEKGIGWINTLTDEKVVNRATYSFVAKWVDSNPDGAAEYVNNLKKGDQRDSAVRSMVYNFDDAEPEYALEWAASMSNAKRRVSLIKDTYTGWRKRDPQGANAWVNSTNLISQAVKNRWNKSNK